MSRLRFLAMLAALVMGGMLVQGSHPVRAATAAIVVSYSDTAVQPVQSLVFYPNDPSLTLYVWAVGVDDPQGVGAFQIDVDYSTLVTIPADPVLTFTSIAQSPTWLGTTNRSVSCGTPSIDNTTGHAYAACNTLGAPPPYGVQGSGLIGTLTIQPGAVLGSGTLDFGQSRLVDTGDIVDNTVIDPAVIPATTPSIPVTVAQPTDEQINITVHNNVATGDLLGGTCWQVFYVASGDNIPVDIVSDNNAKAAACDNLPHLEDLADKDAADGSIRITVSAALGGTYGGQWHVQQIQTPAGYLLDSTKYACDLRLGKCAISSVNAYNPAGDADGDGCSNARELQPAAGSQTSGGRRNPKLFWDYAQMPTNAGLRDGKIRIADVSAVVLRFGTDDNNGTAAVNRNSNPLTTPIPATGYHPAFDRSYVGPNAWNLGPPDGKIRINDISNVVQQFRHDCV